jgi:2-keto-4-pentenoate hydratase/2-oxohepta-3-ene-1,7-dioic acid hydratase in catechol pathway
MQQGCLTDLIYSVPQLIAYCSSFTPLRPGDVIVTGTPAGVGEQRHPPVFLRAGDFVEIEIPGLGRLSNSVIKEM